ncbi:hypothetical protein AO391_10110 [Pseudomonas marginalis ICMP 9505]|uniref:Uncharacterized protein n=1 Tax=Pseudomonas kitaguniensis TaxID=2607908 RepID=A0A5N7JQF8_9PSED|nr:MULTISPECIES: hypothetical protein [Pseudomonas]KTC14724.1 hypothetical protein AO391_10110 [Pseudomonas marginalis ICMP 9505]RMP61857.1 hypothetical protein ALQ18_00246 [Pseudomonas marginalis pv. marginalis]MPQ83630.1 hypothetical protein [Pseudomonas kitaguniensis]MPR01653.1 hypothetical protein [Pseudomonas kitaguniensis]PHN19042.1 hypothetical protein AO240_18105 [Pseudomonas sp. ICMP 460]
MRLLKSLFMQHPRHRNYALLDARGYCLAFKQCTLPPVGEGWVEVSETHIGWMHRPLPTSARVSPKVMHAQTRHSMAS